MNNCKFCRYWIGTEVESCLGKCGYCTSTKWVINTQEVNRGDIPIPVNDGIYIYCPNAKFSGLMSGPGFGCTAFMPLWPPEGASEPVLMEGQWYAAVVDPGSPGVTGGPPDGWEPPEPSCIERLWRLEIKNDWEPEWVELIPDENVTEEEYFRIEEKYFNQF
jgi:hypothetical protein